MKAAGNSSVHGASACSRTMFSTKVMAPFWLNWGYTTGSTNRTTSSGGVRNRCERCLTQPSWPV